MARKMVDDARAEALFVSAVQGSEQPTPGLVLAAIRQAVRAYGTRGCAERVAYEYGEHPELATMRMSWAQAQVRAVFDHA